jgi:hypothetical protein
MNEAARDRDGERAVAPNGGRWPDEPLFTDFGQFGPGNLDLRCFGQQRWWVNRDGVAFEIDSEMSLEYVENVIGFLDQDAAYFHSGVLRSLAIELVATLEAQNAVASREAAFALRSVWEQSPGQWLLGTPLAVALAARRSALRTEA